MLISINAMFVEEELAKPKFLKVFLKDKNNTNLEAIKNVPIYNLKSDIHWSGWVQYFHYDEDDKDGLQPNHFYENKAFFTEVVKAASKSDKDKGGNYKYIQDKHHFWAKFLANGNFNILGSRRNEGTTLADNVENFNTDLIGYVHPTNNANGAIRDLGDFNGGNCIKVKAVVPQAKKDQKFNPRLDSGEGEFWVFCVDREQEKRHLMSYLVSQKIKRQIEIGDTGLTEKKPISVAELMKMKKFKPKTQRYEGRGNSPDDGYWLLLQDWSECSLKCGGGTKTQQWMCVPPKNKGKPCIGDAIRKKPCHNKPCPTVTDSGLNLKSNDPTHITLKPIYKAMPYSKRPQQYIKCIIKENDVLYKTREYDPEHNKAIKVPGRIVMNTKTISVYKDDGYTNVLFTFNLPDTVFSKSSDDHCCFILTNANRQFELCGFNNNCGSIENPIWVSKWGFDFEYFQRKCYEELDDTPLHPEVSKTPVGPAGPGGPNVPLSAAQQEIVAGRSQIIEKKLGDNLAAQMDKQVGTAQKVTLTALRREINLEDLIKNEEMQKGRDETQQLFQQMKQEKKKKNLLEAALVTRENNFGKTRIAKDTQRKIEGIKADAKVDIKFKRGNLKKKIAEIRNKFRRKHRQIQQQIQLIRAQMAGDIMVANKHGDQLLCKDARNDVTKIKTYCDNNFGADYSKNLNCKEPDNFCYSCCETEFGNMFIAQRDDCESMCDSLEKKDLEHGDWIWTTSKHPV